VRRLTAGFFLRIGVGRRPAADGRRPTAGGWRLAAGGRDHEADFLSDLVEHDFLSVSATFFRLSIGSGQSSDQFVGNVTPELIGSRR
jgi:hypothetical protein